MHEVTERPWGSYELIYESRDGTYKVKKIIVNPGQSFSLQYHEHRHEHWIMVEGTGVINNGETVLKCSVGDTFNIPVKQIHRATAGEFGLSFIEVQRGYCNEKDIVRLEDDYGRAGTTD